MKTLPVLIPTKQIDWQKIKFNCCNVGNLFVEPKDAKAKAAGELGDTAKKYLIKIYNKHYWGRKKDVMTRAMEKGLLCEEDLLTLISRVYRTFYVKNKDKKENDWIKGYADIVHEDVIVDGKTSWEADTFLPKLIELLDKSYNIQIQSYMWLWDKPKARLDYGLVNAPEKILKKEKYYLLKSMDVPDYAINSYLNGTADLSEVIQLCDNAEEIGQAVLELEKNMIFDDLPLDERLISINIERDEKIIQRIPSQVEKARNFLEYFQDLHMRKPKKIIEVVGEVLA